MPDLITITYVYNTQTYETSVVAGSKVVLERDPFYFLGKKIKTYTSNESPSVTYLPGQLITAPNSNLTLTVASLEDIGHVKVETRPYTDVDISNAVINIKERKGKNQPFGYVVITVLKELFNDLNLTLTQKETKFTTNVYGIKGTWVYERLEDNGSTYDITVVDKSYYLKTTTLLSLFNFSIANQQGTAITLTNMPVSATTSIITSEITWEDLEEDSNTQYGSFTVTVNTHVVLTFTIKRVDSSDTPQTSHDYTYTLIKVEGSPDDIFKFLTTVVAEKRPDVHIGYYYSTDPAELYTTAQIEALTPNTISDEPEFASVSLRLDQFCWDVLESIALLTDRYITFDGNEARLFHYYYVDANEYIVDWQMPDDLAFNQHYLPVIALSSNEDQGSQYVMSSQKVICEAYETTVAISDTTSTDVGADIVFGSPDNTPLTSGNTDPNAIRNKQARIIALNAIKRRYKPGDCISFSMNISSFPKTNLPDVTDLSTVVAPTNQGKCFKYIKYLDGTSIDEYTTYFQSVRLSGATYVWVEYDTDNPNKNNDYVFDLNACLYKLIDRQNNVTLNSAPLALIETEYPSCITTYTWGMPEFMDEQSQFSELTAVAQDTVLDNTSDTQISSCDASKIVVGNQSISELKHDRSGFTGLIMEKNVDNQVYRLVGYHQGVVQAEFNSFGEIQSGAGNVVINQDGITLNGGVDIILPSDGSKIIAKNVVLDSSGLNAYTNVNPAIENPQQWGTNTLSIGASGNIEAGSGAVQIGVIGSNNLVTKNGNAVQCYISNTGELMAGAGAVKLNSSGMGIYNGSTLQTQINTSGDIVAGGTIVLNGNGLIGYYNTPISTATRSIYISKTGSIAIGGNGGRTLQITGGQINFFADGSVINSDGTVTGTAGAYITDTGMVFGLAPGTVNTAQIVDKAVSSAQIALQGVEEINIKDDAVTTDKIKELAVTTALIDNSAITNAKIANASISTTKIQDAAITTALIDNLAVTNAKIDGLAVGKIETGTLSADCNIILANTGSELLAGPYAPLTIVSIPSSTPSSGPIVQAAKMGTYILFEQQDDFVIESVTSSSGPSISWLTQQSASSYGGIPPVTESMTAYYVTFKFKNANNIEVTINYTVFAILSTNGEKAYRVRLNKDGLFTYDNTGTQVCSVGTDGNITGVTINADQINTSTLTTNTITLSGGSIVAGGAIFNSDGVTIDLPTNDPSSYASANALKFYDSTNQWIPYKLYATYDSSGATSIVKAESKTTGTTIPSKLKMVVDGGGAYGKYTPYTTNGNNYTTYSGYTNFTSTEDYIWLYVGSSNPRTLVTPTNKDSLSIVPGTTVAYESNQNYNLTTSKVRRYTDPVGKTTWSGAHTDSALQTTVSMSPDEYIELYFDLADKTSQSVSITTPDDTAYHSCEFVAYMADGTTYVFKKYSDDGSSARSTRYIFTTGSSTISQVGIRVANTSSSTEYFLWMVYPINLYRSSGDGASVALNQEGTYIQGNNTINGQLYQSGGPIYFKGAGQNIPTYFDMPIVPLAVISQTTVSGATVVSRGGARLDSFACRNIYIDTTAPASAIEGDIFLQLPS